MVPATKFGMFQANDTVTFAVGSLGRLCFGGFGKVRNNSIHSLKNKCGVKSMQT